MQDCLQDFLVVCPKISLYKNQSWVQTEFINRPGGLSVFFVPYFLPALLFTLKPLLP
jgi:hypothetical protein